MDVCLRFMLSLFAAMNVILTNDHINDAKLEISVYGYTSEFRARLVTLALVPAKSTGDTDCSTASISTISTLWQNSIYIASSRQLLFRFDAPNVRSKICLRDRQLSLGAVCLAHAYTPTQPKKILASDARCSLAPEGDCQIALSPDYTTVSDKSVRTPKPGDLKPTLPDSLHPSERPRRSN